MKYTCLKGFHFFLPFIPIVYCRKKTFEWDVILSNSCKYNIGGDQLDWNKLVGISNNLNPRKDSVRFVWRYVIDKNLFEIGIYTEKNKVFESKHLCYVKQDEKFKLKLNCHDTYVLVEVNGKLEIVDFQNKKIMFRLNPYFGGNKTAPNTMSLILK